MIDLPKIWVFALTVHSGAISIVSGRKRSAANLVATSLHQFSILDESISHYVFANAPVAADVCPIGR